MFKRGWQIVLLAAVFWLYPPIERSLGPTGDHAAWAKGSNSGSGSSNSGSGSSGSNSGSGNSGSGSSGSGSSGGSGHDDDDDDDDDSGSGGNSGPGGGGGVQGQSGSPVKGTVGRADGAPLFIGGGGIHVQYTDGRIERIRASVYEALDRRGRLVERHRATGQDERRLKSMGTAITQTGRRSGLLVVAEINELAESAEITDFRGWRERISQGRYTLSDPNGRTVMRRGLMAADVARLRTMLFLD